MDKYQIHSGEFIAFEVLKISSIPHISILSESVAATEQNQIVMSFAQSMANTLTEIYQQYKDKFTRTGVNPDIALDLTWITEPVMNQPYKARINLFISVRAINQNSTLAENSVNEIMALISSTLDADKYEYKNESLSSYYALLQKINRDNVQAIIKEERLEDLQNQYFPLCYAFDTFPTDYQDLGRIVSILIANPDCAVSFQLIPTYYSQDELVEINRSNQALSTLSRGVSDQQVGNMSITAADRVSDLYKYYFDNKSRSLFTYNILVFGSGASLTSVSTRVLGQLNSTYGTTPNLKFVEIPKFTALDSIETIYSQPWVLNDFIVSHDRNVNIWNSGMISNALYRLPYVITADEAANFFRLPIGSDKVNAGLNVNETSKFSKSYSQNLINAGDIEFGKLKSSSRNDSIGLTLNDLAKHMLIVGTPGSGKTTFSVGLLDRLWKEHNIPFLVIEPAKNEYRALVQSIPELQVFTPGKNSISPFVFNPFIPPKNVKLETYKSTLKTAFAAGVSMSTPLDKIFEDTINNCYSDFRWLDTYTVDDKGKKFNITDFIKCFQETFDEIGYTGDARNIGRAGIVRLKSLVNLFDNYFSIPIEDMLTKPTIIELAAIENSDQKALIIALLLLSVLAYVNANYVGEGGLRNFILLEEAHVLLDSSSGGGEGAADPAAIAQGLVKRMLAEIRSYGVGLAIADQSPRKVGIDIVALTDIKVAFRLVEGQDKQILADSTSMSDIQITRLAKLKPGEAFLFFNRLDEPEEIITPNYRMDNKISISLSDESIKELSSYWKDKQDKLRPYPECQICPYCKVSCDYNRRVLAKEVARRIFNKYIKSGAKDMEKVVFVFSKIISLIVRELNDETFDRPLLSCVKVHLWRRIKYETNINVSEGTIQKSLIKE